MAKDEVARLHNLVKTCLSQKDRPKALEYYNKLIEIISKQKKKSDHAKYYLELGKLYQEENNYQEAAKYLIQYIQLNPKDGVTLNEIGICYFRLEKFKEAIDYFEKILAMAQVPDVYNNIANCYRYLKDYPLCEKILMTSYNLQPSNNTKFALTEINYILKEYKKGIYYYLLSDNKTSEHSYNVSFCYLGFKNFRLGFELYEKRLDFNNINKQTNKPDRIEIPELKYWDGKMECNSLLIISEQGFGDNIQYFRFIIELSERFTNMKITLFCNKIISNLFNLTNYPNINIISNLTTNNCIDFYDYKIYTMSLPSKLNITSIDANTNNYIRTNPEKLLYWKEKLEPIKKFKIGFVYNGLLNSYLEKYIPLEEFKTLLDLDVELICIQRLFEIEKDLNTITWADKIKCFDIDKEEPFVDTIHILQSIDLLISIDTYIVHLAGIMGIKTLLLLGKISEWRWSTDDKSYWYNTVEILRMNEHNDLKNIMPLVKKRVQELL